MKCNAFLIRLLAAVLLAGSACVAADEGLVVIGNLPLRSLDAEALKRIFTGRTIEIDGQPLRPLNLSPGNPVRRRFLSVVLQQNDDDYVAYWTVRRYIGQGVPPREMSSAAEVIEQVRRTPGTVGYIDASELTPDVRVLLRR
jgi:ABC-type phosphate transport system substrate-binding protein